jgi:hypothetical protein
VVVDGNPSVKHVAATRPGSPSAFVGTVKLPVHEPPAPTGMSTEMGNVVEVIFT